MTEEELREARERFASTIDELFKTVRRIDRYNALGYYYDMAIEAQLLHRLAESTMDYGVRLDAEMTRRAKEADND